MNRILYVIKRRKANGPYREMGDGCEDDGRACYEKLDYAKVRLAVLRVENPDHEVRLFRRHLSLKDHILVTY